MYMTAVLPSHRFTLNSAPIGTIAFVCTCKQALIWCQSLVSTSVCRVLPSHRLTLNSAPIDTMAFVYIWKRLLTFDVFEHLSNCRPPGACRCLDYM